MTGVSTAMQHDIPWENEMGSADGKGTYCSFKSLLNGGRNRPYFSLQISYDTGHLLHDDRFLWTCHLRQRKESNCCSRKILITGASYNRTSRYFEEPVMSVKCYRWGHKARGPMTEILQQKTQVQDLQGKDSQC